MLESISFGILTLKMPRTYDPSHLPMYFDKLDSDDQEEYKELRKKLNSPSCKNRRNKSIETFKRILKSIKEYAIRGDNDDSLRCFVCGIIWLKNGIAINTHQLSLIISKCKSSINWCFQLMGYETIPTAADSAGEIIRMYPFLKNNFPELRKWTVRRKVNGDSCTTTDEKCEKVTSDNDYKNMDGTMMIEEFNLIPLEVNQECQFVNEYSEINEKENIELDIESLMVNDNSTYMNFSDG